VNLTKDFQAAVIGGDQRQIIVAKALTDLFGKVKIFGHPPSEVPNPLENCLEIVEALKDAKIIVLPIGGMNDAGMIRSYRADQWIDFGSHFDSLPEKTVIMTGSFTRKWLERAETLKIRVLQYADDDEIAILNSIPTAEGTVEMAMRELPITIHGSTVIVIGLGRVGITVARVFKALGADVIVSARRKASLARAFELRCETVLIESLSQVIGRADLIVNTVPAPVINEELLNALTTQILIIDLASAPGGTDFETAKRLNIKAILAPGLPGIVAPKTAGAILASSIPRLLQDFLKGEVLDDAAFRN
jgi:dipicolinate synthase subunit A